MGLAADQVVRINGTTYSWNSVAFNFAAVPIEGIVQCDWEESREQPLVYAARRDGKPVARAGGGKYSPPTFKVKMLLDTWEFLKTTVLVPLGLGSFGDAVFPFAVQAIETTVVQAMASGCKVVHVARAQSEGTEALFVELTISSLDFIENGVPLWSVQRAIL